MWFLLALLCFVSSAMAQNLLQNADMESLASWRCRPACILSDTPHSGEFAIQTTGRNGKGRGPSQNIPLEPGKIYSISFWVRLVNDIPGKLGQKIAVVVRYVFTDKSKQNQGIAVYKRIRVVDGWIQMKGIVTVPNKPIKSAKLLMNGPDAGVDFVIDDAAVELLPEWTNWRQDTDNAINLLRKSNINIDVTTAAEIEEDQVEISITQLKKSFPFGTAVKCDEYHHGDTRYQDFINQHFNWAVIENGLKWKLMEKSQGQINYLRPINALEKLKSNGIKVRGHNILWSPLDKVPTWVQPLWNDTLREVTEFHIVDIVSRTKDLVDHWDVNNENLDGFFFQDHVNDFDYNLDVFQLAHDTAPNVKMFLNEYNVVAGGITTSAYLFQAEQFKNANVGLYGIGVQSHFGEKTINPTIIKARLDILAEAGVPIWVTEMDVANSDENMRADNYETVLRVLYGHPAVEGILFWGFWGERHFRGDIGSLVSGPEFRLNAAGQRVLDLFENQWMTNETLKLSETGNHFAVAGFHGDYEVRVSYRGEELTDERRIFTLGEYSHDVSLSVE